MKGRDGQIPCSPQVNAPKEARKSSEGGWDDTFLTSTATWDLLIIHYSPGFIIASPILSLSSDIYIFLWVNVMLTLTPSDITHRCGLEFGCCRSSAVTTTQRWIERRAGGRIEDIWVTQVILTWCALPIAQLIRMNQFRNRCNGAGFCICRYSCKQNPNRVLGKYSYRSRADMFSRSSSNNRETSDLWQNNCMYFRTFTK